MNRSFIDKFLMTLHSLHLQTFFHFPIFLFQLHKVRKTNSPSCDVRQRHFSHVDCEFSSRLFFLLLYFRMTMTEETYLNVFGFFNPPYRWHPRTCRRGRSQCFPVGNCFLPVCVEVLSICSDVLRNFIWMFLCNKISVTFFLLIDK